VVLVVAMAACTAGWKGITPDPAQDYPPRDEMQVWMHGVAQRWHGLRVDSTTVSGVPYTRPPECDSCRITVPRASVDSIRLGHPEAAFWQNMLLLFVTGSLTYLAFFKTGA
jgi:hypothetical protein